MCVIAGYVGKRQAAPILLEMMRKIEYIDGGVVTGIATIHEGKLYHAKIQGNTDTLIQATDALNLPGTVGIIHTRPGADFISMAHPYLDAEEKLGLVENGTPMGTGTDDFFRVQRDIMNDLLARGIESRAQGDLDPVANARTQMTNGRSFYYIEPYAFSIGEEVAAAPEGEKKAALAAAVKRAHERMPADNITVSVHADVPDTITVGMVTRPMSVCVGDGETFIASVALAFPEEVQDREVVHLPVTSVSQITPDGFEILATEMDGVQIEPIGEKIKTFYREALEQQIMNHPLSMYEMDLSPDIWDDEKIDCKYLKDKYWLKPIFSAVYQVLWDFHKEGRLGWRPGNVHFASHDQTYMKFWLNK